MIPTTAPSCTVGMRVELTMGELGAVVVEVLFGTVVPVVDEDEEVDVASARVRASSAANSFFSLCWSRAVTRPVPHSWYTTNPRIRRPTTISVRPAPLSVRRTRSRMRS